MCFQYFGYVMCGNQVCVYRRNHMARMKQDQPTANVNTQMFVPNTCCMTVQWDYTKTLSACSQQIKNALAWKSLNSAWSVLTKVKLILRVDLLLWMRLVLTIAHQNPNSSQNSGQKPVVRRQRRQGRFHRQERSWHRCFGMLKAFCSLIILKRVKQ